MWYVFLSTTRNLILLKLIRLVKKITVNVHVIVSQYIEQSPKVTCQLLSKENISFFQLSYRVRKKKLAGIYFCCQLLGFSATFKKCIPAKIFLQNLIPLKLMKTIFCTFENFNCNERAERFCKTFWWRTLRNVKNFLVLVLVFISNMLTLMHFLVLVLFLCLEPGLKFTLLILHLWISLILRNQIQNGSQNQFLKKFLKFDNWN